MEFRNLDFAIRISNQRVAISQESAASNSKFEIQVGLGNTRLAILDLSAADHQPMQDSEAGLTITYNGEVYNFRELRAEIGDAFGPWQSNTDTEVVLRAFRLWGVDSFAKPPCAAEARAEYNESYSDGMVRDRWVRVFQNEREITLDSAPT